MTDRTILEALTGSVEYRIPVTVIGKIAIRRNIDTEAKFSAEIARMNAYRLCEADLLRYLVGISDVAEKSVSISVCERNLMAETANAIYVECGELTCFCR